MKGRKRIVSALLSASALVCLTACGANAGQQPVTAPSGGNGQTAQTMQTVHFSEVIRSIFYAPYYVALGKGFFKDAGLNVDMVTAQGSDKGAAALLAGTADISLIGPETAIYINNQKGEKKLNVFAQLTQVDGSFLLSRDQISDFKWSNVNGKSIVGWRVGSDPQMVLQTVLQKNGVSSTNVLTNIAAPAMVGAFESGKGDFIQEYEPIASQLEQSGKAHVVASLGEAGGQFPETAFIATTAYIKQHPDIIQKWTAAVYKATQWTMTHSPDEVADVTTQYFTGTSKELVAKSVERYQKEHAWDASLTLSKAQFDTLQNVMETAGQLKASDAARYEDIANNTFAEKAAQEAK